MDLENIDIVYCWCDGKDPDFRKRKNYFLKSDKGKCVSLSVQQARWEQEQMFRRGLLLVMI